MPIATLETYLLARLKEPSTWAGLAALCTALSVELPDQARPFSLIAACASAVVSVLRKDAAS